MEIRKCLNCMSDIDSAVCPQCGFDENKILDDPFVLRSRTILRGRYLVGRVIGQGGFGITYVGVDLVLNLKVAIKEYYPMGMVSRDHATSNNIRWNSHMISQETWSQGCEGFIKEAREMARFNDLNHVVRVRDTFYENQTAYIVMDFVEGVTLKDWLKTYGTISYAQCVSMMEPLMKDLSTMHQKGLIHRDISPDNIMVRPDGSLCLLDLGAAKDIKNQKNGRSQLVTKSGFSPAEQYIESGQIGAWTDVYALCATIYYAISGQLVPDAMERAYKKEEFALDSRLTSVVSQETTRILTTGLAVKHDDRIQNIDILLRCMKNDLKDSSRSNVLEDSDAITVQAETVLVTTGETQKVETEKTEGKTEQKDKKKSKKGRILIIIVAIIILILIIAAVTSGKDESKDVVKESETQAEVVHNVLTVEKLGNSNANVLNDGGYAVIEDQYEYFIDQDKNLCVCTFDTEDQTFYVDESVVVAQNVMYICVGEEKVYYCQMTDNGYVNSICSMDFDGSNIETLSQQQAIMFMQYAKTSDGMEYIYLVDEPEDDTMASVSRINVNTGHGKTVLENTMWFNIYEDSIYHTSFDGSNWTLNKSDLNGENTTVLTDKDIFPLGFVEDDYMYMYAYNGEYFARLGLDGEILNTYYNIPLSEYYTISYGNGWVYYSDVAGQAVHRMRPDGSGDEVIYEGSSIVSIAYNNQWLWMFEREESAKVYLVYRDGTSLLDVTEALYGEEETEFPLAAIEDLTYELTEEEHGMIITGYTGDLVELSLPSKIDGYPVVEIGENAFYDSPIKKIQLPDTVEFIWKHAFGSSNVSYVSMPSNLLGIAAGAFSWCIELETIELPESLLVIGEQAFYGSELTEVTIPKNVTYIGEGAFSYLSLSFEGFRIASQTGCFQVHEGVLYEYDEESGIRTLLAFPRGKDVEDGVYAVTGEVHVIAGHAFDNCQQIYDLIITPSVTEIRDWAFRNCDNLNSAYIENPDCVVGEDAFGLCDKEVIIEFAN